MLNDVFSYLEKIKTILHSTGSKQMYGFLLVCVCECVFFFFSFRPCCAACRILLVPDQGLNLGRLNESMES